MHEHLMSHVSDHRTKITAVIHPPELKQRSEIEKVAWFNCEYEKKPVSDRYIWVITVMIRRFYRGVREDLEFERTFCCRTEEEAKELIPGYSWDG